MAAAAVAAMNARRGSVTAQRSGCSALMELAKGAAGAQEIVDAGGVAAVVAAEVLFSVLSALHRLPLAPTTPRSSTQVQSGGRTL